MSRPPLEDSKERSRSATQTIRSTPRTGASETEFSGSWARANEMTGRLERVSPEEPIALGRYLVTRKLGAGAMGMVFEALDRDRGVKVALKTLHALEPEALYRLKEEFRRVAHVQHRNLAVLHELVSEDNVWFFTMELVDGVGFLEYVREPDEEPGESS